MMTISGLEFNKKEKRYRQLESSGYNDAVISLIPCPLLQAAEDGANNSYLAPAAECADVICSFSHALPRYPHADISICEEKTKTAENYIACLPGSNTISVVQINTITIGLIFPAPGAGEFIVKLLVKRARRLGAGYLIAVLPDGNTKLKPEEYAEAGADLIIDLSGESLSREKLQLSAEKQVDLISGLLAPGLAQQNGDTLSALVRVRLLATQQGTVNTVIEYIPVLHAASYRNEENVLLPLNRSFLLRMPVGYKEMTEEIAMRFQSAQPYDARVPVKLKSAARSQLSMADICEILKIPAKSFKGKIKMNEKFTALAAYTDFFKPGCLAVAMGYPTNREELDVRWAAENGAKAVMCAPGQEEGMPVPCIVVDNPKEAYQKLVRAIKKKYSPVTVAITGSYGKSTVTGMISAVIDEKYSLLTVSGNINTWPSISMVMQGLQDRYTAYVQEVHGGSRTYAAEASSILRPDACVVTAVGPVHLSQLGTIDDVLREKLSISSGLKKKGVLFVNNDNTYLQRPGPAVKTIRYAANNPASDYYARNIVETAEGQSFTIVSPEGEFSAHIALKGDYNVCNAIGAFAVGRHFGVPPENCIAALARYRGRGIRQNIVEANDKKFLVDCFNANPDSVRSALNIITSSDAKRKVCILGDMVELGSKFIEYHQDTGAYAQEAGIDLMITVGEVSIHMHDKLTTMPAVHFADNQEAIEKIPSLLEPGDFVLIKASHAMNFKEIADALTK